MITKQSWIDKANEHVSISDVLSLLGVYVPSDVSSGGSKKVYCPFGFYHSDGGSTRAMRIYYNTNTAYCFSCSKRYTPVKMAAAAWDCPWNTAAMRLLEDSGFKPKTLKERWAEATILEENKPDLIALADALKMFCEGVSPDWASRQYSDDVSDKLASCLKLLELVRTPEDSQKWLNACKKVMTNVLVEE